MKFSVFSENSFFSVFFSDCQDCRLGVEAGSEHRGVTDLGSWGGRTFGGTCVRGDLPQEVGEQFVLRRVEMVVLESVRRVLALQRRACAATAAADGSRRRRGGGAL